MPWTAGHPDSGRRHGRDRRLSTRETAAVASAPAPPLLLRYVDGLGVRRTASPEAVRLVAEALGDVATTPACVVEAGRRAFEFDLRDPGLGRSPSEWRGATLALEEGGELPLRLHGRTPRGLVRLRSAEPIPMGVHWLHRAGRRDARRLVLARPRSLAPTVEAAGLRLALFLPLHAVRSQAPFGVGSFSDLERLSAWAERTAGALTATLPLFPAFLGAPFDPSPYAPVSRLMWNELFVEPAGAPEWSSASVRRWRTSPRVRRRAAELRRGPLVDHRASWALAREALRRLAAAARSSPQRWAELVARTTAETRRYALFRAAVDAVGGDWRSWPAGLRAACRRGSGAALEGAGVSPGDADLYVYAQAMADQAMHRLARQGDRGHGRLCLDLPVGAHAGGFDTLMHPELFVHGLSAGAPPDALNARGQSWGFPPMHPTAGRADGYAHLRGVLRRLFAVADVLRVDHVMGLHRMYCIPAGLPSEQGLYLRYPDEELFAVVLIEAARAGATLVGEDLGTTPPQVRRLMRRFGVLGMHVQQFALEGAVRAGATSSLPMPDRHVQASLNTHDTPTFAGYWRGDDLALRARLDRLRPEVRRAREPARRAVRAQQAGAPRGAESANAAMARSELAERSTGLQVPDLREQARVREAVRRLVLRALSAAGETPRSAPAVAMALLRRLARSPAPLVMVSLEDLWGERLPQNVPGTAEEHPNWRRRAAKPLSEILSSRALARALCTLAEERAKASSHARRRAAGGPSTPRPP